MEFGNNSSTRNCGGIKVERGDVMSNELKAKLRARLTAARDFKNDRGCEPARYANIPSAYATWYTQEYMKLENAGEWVNIEKRIDDIIAEREALR